MWHIENTKLGISIYAKYLDSLMHEANEQLEMLKDEYLNTSDENLTEAAKKLKANLKEYYKD